MIYRLDNHDEFESDDPPRSRPWISIITVLALAATGSAAALLYRSFENSFSTLRLFEPTTAGVPEKVAMQKELQEFRQQVTGQIQEATRLLGSQQAEIGRLSEQLTALAKKLELLQRPPTLVQGPPPPPISKPVAPRVPLPQKKPADRKPAEPPPDGAQAPPLQLNR